MKSVKLLLGAAFACGIALSAGTTASNAATYTLSACNGSLGCGTGNNYGTVSVTADGANTVRIDVDLASGVEWAGTGLVGFAFYVPGISGVTLTNAPAGSVLPNSTFWTPNTNNAPLLTSLDTDGFKGPGSTQIANFGLDRTDNGTSSHDTSNLTFDITATGLSVNSFQSWFGNDQPTTAVYFIADLGVGGKTGLVGATLFVPCDPSVCTQNENPPGTPIPGAVWLFGTVLAGGAGYGRWRKRRKAQLAA